MAALRHNFLRPVAAAVMGVEREAVVGRDGVDDLHRSLGCHEPERPVPFVDAEARAARALDVPVLLGTALEMMRNVPSQ